MALAKNWRIWLHGLIATCIGAMATGILSAFAINGSGLDIKWRQFWITIGIGGLLQACAYLKQSPLPPMEDESAKPPTEPKL